MFMAFFLYWIEVIRYGLGNNLIFSCRLKRLRVALPGGLFFCIVVISNPWDFRAATIYLTGYILAAITAFFMLEEKSFFKKVLYILSLLCVFGAVDEIIGMALSHAFEERGFGMEEASLIEGAISAGVLGLLNLVKRIVKRKRKAYEKVQYNTVILGVIVLCGCLIVIVGGLFFLPDDTLFSGKRNGVKLIGALVYGCVVCFILFTAYIKKVNDKLGELVETECMLQDMQKEYYTALLSKEEDTRRYRHDMNNHLICLADLIKQGLSDEAQIYISELQGKMDDIKGKHYVTGNDILDIILNSQLAGIKDIDVTVRGQSKRPLNISNVELCIIISNLLKNAIEETESISGQKKYIDILVKEGEHYFTMEIKNPSPLYIDANVGQIKTKKKDKRNHGIGLGNVAETVKKNEGDFYLSGDGAEVCAKVVLKVKE